MLSITDLTYRIGARLLLDHASAAIPTGARVGLVGRNGIGKSTLFRLILGEIHGESGSIDLPRRARIAHVAQEAPSGDASLIGTVIAAHVELADLLHQAEHAPAEDQPAIHARLAALDGYRAEARAAQILAGLGFDAAAQARPCGDFSGGWRMRVALAGALFAEPDLLLLDEPTNYLDLEGVMWLETFLKSYRHTVIVISHDRDFLNRVADGILHLDNLKLAYYPGDFERFMARLAADRERIAAEARRIDSERARIQAFVDRFRAKASKARQAQSRMKALAKLTPITLASQAEAPVIHFPAPERLSPPLMAIDGVAVGYEPGHPILKNLTLRLDPDDRVALVGQNGNGKSTFAKLLSGRLKPEIGRIVTVPKLAAGYFAQHQLDELDEEATPLLELARRLPRASERELRTRLGGAGFSADKAGNKIATLSGGEKARLLFAMIGIGNPALLILDEPTNHLDLDAREALITALQEFPGAVVFISHDRHFVETCADRIWLVANGTVAPFDGDLDDYEKLVLSERRAAASEKAAATKRKGRRQTDDQRQRLSAHQKAVDEAEAQLHKLAAERAKVQQVLTDSSLYEAANNAKLMQLTRRDADLAEEIAQAEAAWLAASEALEA